MCGTRVLPLGVLAMNKCITVALVCVYKYMCRVKRSIVCNRRERECVCVCVCVCVCARAREVK